MSDHIDLQPEEVSVLEAFLQLKSDLGLETNSLSISKDYGNRYINVMLEVIELDHLSRQIRRWGFIKSDYREKDSMTLFVSDALTGETINTITCTNYGSPRGWEFYPMYGPHRTGFTKFRSLPRSSQLRILKNAWPKST